MIKNPIQGFDISQARKFSTPANTICIIGDSITGNIPVYQGNPVTMVYWSNYFAWANSMLGHRFKILKCAGVGGEDSGQILARIYSDVVAYKPGYCFVNAGQNDINRHADDVTEVITNLEKMYQILTDNNIRVITATLITNITWDDTFLQKIFRINNWIKKYARENPNIILCDWYSAMSDPSTGVSRAEYVADSIHPNQYGHAILGKVIYDALKNIVPTVSHLLNSNSDAGNMIGNGLMLGDVSGVATDWVVSSYTAGFTYTASKVTRPDEIGEWQQVVSEVEDCVSYLRYQNSNVGVDWNIGDTVYAQCEYEMDDPWVNKKNFCLSLEMGGIAVSDLRHYAAYNSPYVVSSGVFRTPEYQIPAGSTKLSFYIYFTGAGTFRIGRAEIRKVVSPY
jgi:lysophospholipase L1-like esterase